MEETTFERHRRRMWPNRCSSRNDTVDSWWFILLWTRQLPTTRERILSGMVLNYYCYCYCYCKGHEHGYHYPPAQLSCVWSRQDTQEARTLEPLEKIYNRCPSRNDTVDSWWSILLWTRQMPTTRERILSAMVLNYYWYCYCYCYRCCCCSRGWGSE